MTITTATRTVRAAIYVRISKDRVGAGLGVERQEDDCRLLAAMLGWDVVAVYVDNDMSAYSGKPRKRYLAMLADIEAGKIDAVLAWHTDRLHRSPAELERYITVCQPRDVPTHCHKAGHLDLATPSGRLVARQLGAVARYESEHLAERVRAQKAARRAKGGRLGGSRPFGWERDGHTQRPDEAELIRAAVTDALAGASMRGIALRWDAVCPRSEWTQTMVSALLESDPATLSEQRHALYVEARRRVDEDETLSSVACDWTDRRVPNGNRWNSSTVRTILCNPRHAGLVSQWTSSHVPVAYDDQPVRAQWYDNRIVEEDQWRAVHAKLTDPSRMTHESNSLRWVGSALYRCGVCGGQMRNSGTRRHNGQTMAVYRCRANGHCAMPAGPVDWLVLDAVADLLTRDGANLLAHNTPTVNVVQLHADATSYRAQLDQYADERVDKKITDREYYRLRDRVAAKLDAVERTLASVGAGSVLTGIADAPDPVAAFRASTVDRQRAVINDLVIVTIMPGTRGRPARAVDGVDLTRVRIKPRRTMNGPVEVAA